MLVAAYPLLPAGLQPTVCLSIPILLRFNLQNVEAYATICTLFSFDSLNQLGRRDMIDSDVD